MGELLKGKVAVVTGSGQGIGRAVALSLASQGARVITNNRRKGAGETKQLTADMLSSMSMEQRDTFRRRCNEMFGDAGTTAETINSLGGEAYPFYGDISVFEVAKELIETALRVYGSIDIVANIAGAFGFGSVADITEETWDRVNNTKPKGYFNTIHFAAPYMMEKKWGRIINCTSRAFLGDRILHPEYCAANAGVVGLTRAVAIELFPYGITCNAFEPFAQTRASADLEAATQQPVSAEKLVMPGTMLPKFEKTPTPDAIAPFITYLATDAAAEISGSIFSLAGNSVGIYSEPEVKRSVTKYSEEHWTVEELMEQMPGTIFKGYKGIAED